MDWLPIGFAALAGGLFGLAADRLATRWPEHEPGTATRGLDWRTAVVTLAGAAVAAGLVWRWSEPFELAVLGFVAAALVVLLATDLDQRLLPDLVTIPLALIAAGLLLAGASPLLADRDWALVSGVAAGIGAPLLLVVSDVLLRGELGGGDVKLAAGVGLLAGVTRFFTGFLVASVVFSLILVGLMVARRVGRRSAVPFGPVLIGAGFVAMVMP